MMSGTTKVYGHFEDALREYVITDPKTPVKWINYIGSLAFGGFVDQTGGMLICSQDPALNRITKYLTQDPPSEFRATTLYLRKLQAGGGYQVFSPFYVPTLTPYERYECHVGLGYSTFLSEVNGIQTEVRIFIPPGEKLVVQEVTVTNLTEDETSVDLIPVVEYTHPDALKQLNNADWVPQTMQSYLLEEDGGLKVLSQAPFMTKDTQRNFFTANLPISSFESDRALFLGHDGYGSWVSPGGLQEDELSSKLALRGDNIGALMLHLGVVPAGESRRAILLLGQTGSVTEALPAIKRYRNTEGVEKAFSELGAFWESILSTAQVHTPDSDMDRMLNIHNPRQCAITMNWSRYLSLYQLGFGARGMGFRDSSQDVMGAIAGSPEASKALLIKLLAVQKRNGAAMHQFNPLSMVATMGDSASEEGRPIITVMITCGACWQWLSISRRPVILISWKWKLPFMRKTRTKIHWNRARFGSISGVRFNSRTTPPGRMACPYWAMQIGTIRSTCRKGRNRCSLRICTVGHSGR